MMMMMMMNMLIAKVMCSHMSVLLALLDPVVIDSALKPGIVIVIIIIVIIVIMVIIMMVIIQMVIFMMLVLLKLFTSGKWIAGQDCFLTP